MTNLDKCELLCLSLPSAENIRTHRPSLDELEAGADKAQGLADPTRLMLAAALAEGGELCVCDLAWISERAQNLVSHHLRALKYSGLVRSRRSGKMALYSLTDAGRSLVEAVLSLQLKT